MDWWSNKELFSTFFAFLDPRIDQPWRVNGKAMIQVSRNDNLFPGVFMEDEAALWSGVVAGLQPAISSHRPAAIEEAAGNATRERS